jgi:PhnB protein
MTVKPIPDGLHTITPHLIVREAKKAIEFYKQAFGAESKDVCEGPDGAVMHAELRIGDSVVFIADEFPMMGCVGPQTLNGTSVTLHLFVPDVDKSFKRAIEAGAKETMPVSDQFWGDRYGQLQDPFGHKWSIATHKEDLTPEQMKERQKEAMKQFAGAHK